MFINICGLWKSTKENNRNLSGVIDLPVDLTLRAGQKVVLFLHHIPPEQRKTNGPCFQASIAPLMEKENDVKDESY